MFDGGGHTQGDDVGEKELKETDRFVVVDEAGNRYRVIEYTKYEHKKAIGGPGQTIEMGQSYQTPDKRVEKDVYPIDDDSFKLSVFDWTISGKQEIIAKRE